MRGYVILIERDRDQAADVLARKTAVDLTAALGAPRVQAPPFKVWASSDLDVRIFDGGVCVGQIFGAKVTGAIAAPFDALAAARAMSRHCWGRYVATWRDHSVYRSPLGFLDAYSWARGALAVVASAFPAGLERCLPSQAKIDLEAVARFLRREPQGFGLCPIKGVVTVAPGELVGPAGRQQVWRWADYCSAPSGQADRDPAALRALVQGTIGAWAERFPAMGCEVSGGLDSAIVAACLGKLGARPKTCVNYHEPTRGGDERGYVQHLSSQLGLAMTYVAKHDERFDLEALQAAAGGLRPATAGLDAAADADLAERLGHVSAQAVFGGQGGDAVFFQMPSALVAADPLFGVGRRDFAALCADVARWNGSTAWSVMRQAATARLRRREAVRDVGPPLAREIARWRPPARALGVAPAKDLQAQALQNSQVFFGPCRRADTAAVIHPLLSQPIVEHCLALPASVLTGGVRDRAYAREAFASMLPSSIAQRRSKGLLSSYYARHVATNADVIGDYLSNGRLAAMGLIDRQLVARMLEPHQLIQRSDLSVLLSLALMEAWVRVWEPRLAGARAQS